MGIYEDLLATEGTDPAKDAAVSAVEKARASGMTSDEYAKALNVAESTSLPVDVVQRNPQEAAKKRASLYDVDYDTLFSEAPEAKAWLAERDNANLVSDDLSFIPTLKRRLTQIPQAFESGTDQVRRNELYAKGIFSPLSPDEQAEVTALDQSLEGVDYMGQSVLDYATVGVANTAPQLVNQAESAIAGGAAGGAATGGAYAGYALLGGQLGPQAAAPEEVLTVPTAFGIGFTKGMRPGAAAAMFYTNFVQNSGSIRYDMTRIQNDKGQKLDPNVVNGAAVIAGAANAGLDLLPFEKYLRTIPGVDKIPGVLGKEGIKQAIRIPGVQRALYRVGKRIADAGLTEGTTEAIQQAVQIAATEAAKGASDGDFEPVTFADAADQITTSFVAGATIGTGIATPLGAAQLPFEMRSQKLATPDQVAAHVDGIHEAARTSTLYQRSPTRFHDLVNALAPEDRLYINPEAFAQMIGGLPADTQEAINAAVPDLSVDLETALTTGADVAMRKADYAALIAPLAEADQLRDFIKIDPADMSVAERAQVQQFAQANPDAARLIQAELANPLPSAPEEMYSAVERVVKKALRDSGRSAEEARSVAPLFSRTIARFSTPFGNRAADILNNTLLQFQEIAKDGTPLRQGSSVGVLLGDLEKVRAGKSVQGLDEQGRAAVELFGARMDAAGITPEQASTMQPEELMAAIDREAQIDADVTTMMEQQYAVPQVEFTGEGENLRLSLTANTNTISGIALLSDQAQQGDPNAHRAIQSLAENSLRRLLSGTSTTAIQVDPATGLYGGYVGPSLGVSVSFDEAERPAVLAAVARIAQMYNQEQVHVRGPATLPGVGAVYDDGSYNTEVFRIDTTRALSKPEVENVIAQSGLYGLTFGSNFVEAYYVGDPADTAGFGEFVGAAERAALAVRDLGASGGGVGRSVERLWVYGEGSGAIPYDTIAGDVRTAPPGADPNTRVIAERYFGDGVAPAFQARTISEPQARLQRRIAAEYEQLPDNDMANPLVRRAYDELVTEVKEQYRALPLKEIIAHVKRDADGNVVFDENGDPVGADGEPYGNSEEMRRDVQDRNRMVFYATTPSTFGPPGVDFSGHPLLAETEFTDSRGYKLLANDLLRVVHDYFAHNLAPTNFGPRGEEAAWINHMRTTRSPWARWALTTETRGQNSWVNFNAEVYGRDIPIPERPFARQKAALLPIEYSMTGDPAVDAPVAELAATLDPAQAAGSLALSQRVGAEEFAQSMPRPTDLDELGFFSKMRRFLDTKLNPTGTLGQYRDQIAAFIKAGHFKQEEYFWSGLEDFLTAQRADAKITRDDVLRFLDDNRFQLEEVGEQANKTTYADEITEDDFSRGPDEYIDPDPSYIEETAKDVYYDDILEMLTNDNNDLDEEDRRSEAELENDAMEQAMERAQEDYDSDEENYARVYNLRHDQIDDPVVVVERYGNLELSINGVYDDDYQDWPRLLRALMEYYADRGYVFGGEEDGPQFARYTGDGGENYAFWRLRVPSGLKGGTYHQRGHYDESDVVIHFRTKDRVGPSGEKMLFIEEVQSDLHQAAYKNKIKGGAAYKTDIPPEERAQMESESADAYARYDAAIRASDNAENALHNDLAENYGYLPSRLREMLQREAKALAATGDREYVLSNIKYYVHVDATDSWVAADLEAGRIDLRRRRKVRSLLDELYDYGQNGYETWDRFVGLFVGPDLIDYIRSIPEPQVFSRDAVIALLDEIMARHPDLTTARAELAAANERNRTINERIRSLDTAPPLAPFVKTWREVAFKRLLMIAADRDYKSIGWTTGTQQNIRYNLSRFIRDMRAVTHKDGYLLMTGSVQTANALVQSGGQAIGGSTTDVYVPNDKLEDVLGVPGAEAVRAQVTQGDTPQMVDFAQEIEVGGEKKGNLYDSMLPQEARKILRKLDPKITVERIPSDMTENGRRVNSIWYAPFTEEARESTIQGFELFQRERGSIRYSADLSRVVVSFTERADFSTAVHEFAHFGVAMHRKFAELARERIAQGDTTLELARIAEDWQKLKKFVGAKDDLFTVDQEETLARSFEAYMREGNAPSEYLRRIFARFRDWLTKIYKDITGLGVEINDDVRGVFDRWLASEAEIAQVQQRNAALAEIAQNLGLEDSITARVADYVNGAMLIAEEKLYEALDQEQKKRESAAYSRELDAMRQTVAGEYRERREFNLMNYLRDNGFKLLEGPETLGIPEDILTDDADAENTIHPDQVADLYGYDSGLSMLRALRSAPGFDRAVDAEARRRLMSKYPDMIKDGRIRNEAVSAIMNDKTLLALDLMIQELGKAVGGGSAVSMKAYARVMAQSQVAKMKIGEANYQFRYEVAREKAMREALIASRQGRPDEAMLHLQRAMVNQLVYKELDQFKETRAKAEALFERVNRKDKDIASSLDIDFIGAARFLLAQYGLSSSNFNILGWLNDVAERDPDIQGDLQQMMTMVMADPKPLKEMSIAEYLDLYHAVENVTWMARKQREFDIGERKLLAEKARADLIAQIGKLPEAPATEGFGVYGKAKFHANLMALKAMLRRVEHWISSVDGGNSGPFRRLVWEPVSRASNAYRAARQDWNARLHAIFKKHREYLSTEGRIEAPELGRTFRDRLELIGFLLHTGNESNLEKLLGGYGISEESYIAGIRAMQKDGRLTARDYEIAQEFWDFAEDLKPLSQRAHKKLYGYRFDEIESLPIDTMFGTYRGGYWPAIADYEQVDDKVAERAVQDAKQYMLASTNKGFTKARNAQYRRPLSTDLRLASSHMDTVLKFSYLEPTIREVSRLIAHTEFRDALKRVDPAAYSDMLAPWLRRTAQQTTSQPTAIGERGDALFGTAARWLRSSASAQAMMLNLVNAIQNFTSFPIVIYEVGPRNFSKAFARYIANPRGVSNQVRELSTMMRTRQNVLDMDITNEIAQIVRRRGIFTKGKQAAIKHGYIFQRLTQNMVDNIAWMAAYSSAQEDGLTGTDAVERADSAVRMSQASGAPEDISKIEAGSDLAKLFLMFYTYFNNLANYVGTEAATIVRQHGWYGSPKLFYLYLMTVAIPAVLGDLMVRWLRDDLPADDDDDGETIDDWLAWFAGSQAKYVAASVPYAGQVFNAMLNSYNERPYDDRITASPVITYGEGAIRFATTITKEDGYTDDSRAVRDGLNAIGFLTGLPLGQIGKPAGFVADVNEGDTSPKDPGEWVRGLLAGPPVQKQ